MKTAVQLYSLRNLDRSIPDLLDLVAETPLSGVEFAGIDDRDAVVAALDRTGLAAPAAHVPIDVLENDPSSTAETYRGLGCETLVVPYLDGSHFAERETIERTADRLSTLATDLEEHGLDLAYHNHDHEFAAIGAAPAGADDAFAALVPALDGCGIELDLGWVTAAGHDPVDTLERYADRIDLVHLKDVDGDEPCALGEGDVPLEDCVEAAHEANVEWLIYEHDDPADPEATLRRDAEAMTALLE